MNILICLIQKLAKILRLKLNFKQFSQFQTPSYAYKVFLTFTKIHLIGAK